MKKQLWEVTIKYDDGAECIRRIHANGLVVGASPKAQIKLARPAPELCFSAEKKGSDETFEISTPEGSQIEFRVGDKWVKKSHYKGVKIPELRVDGTVFGIKEISKDSGAFHFEPVNWAANFSNEAKAQHALWHFRGDVLIETIFVERRNQTVTMKCGYEFHWNAKRPGQIELKSHDGQVHTLTLEQGPKGSLRAKFGQDIFFLTGLPKQSTLVQIPRTAVLTPEKEPWSRLTIGLATFWLLFFILVEILPRGSENVEKPVEPVKIESIGSDMKTITVQNHKNPGGNGKRGGGGVEHVKTHDVRGGSGRTGTAKHSTQSHVAAKVARTGGSPIKTKLMAKNSGASSKVKTKSLAIPMAAGGSMNSALAKLDAGVRHGKYSAGGGAPMAGGGKDNTGRDGVLGTLGKMSGTPGGNGLGIGGVGTKGFGGGGGGGQGAGFGTGIGEGLGEGHGRRQIAFGNGGTMVRGGLEKSEIDAVVQENMSQIRYCFNKRLRTNPNLQGKVISAFTIGANGRVRTSRIKDSSLGAPDVDSCIMSRVASWTFPKPRGGGEVSANVPFLLKAN